MLDLNRTVPVGRVFWLAQNLRSESGENPEYDRALVELLMDVAGVSHEKYRDRVDKIVHGPMLDENVLDDLVECAGQCEDFVAKTTAFTFEEHLCIPGWFCEGCYIDRSDNLR